MESARVDSVEGDAVRDARRSLLKVIWEASGVETIATKFSSKPLDIDGYFTRSNAGGGAGSSSEAPTSQVAVYRESLFSASYLTANEKNFLEELLQSEDHKSIQFASKRLANKILFPPIEDEPPPGEDENNSSREADDAKTQSLVPNGNNVVNPSEREFMSSKVQDSSFAADFESWIVKALQEDEKQSSPISTPTTGPFMILGVSSDATTIHPRVLSPPLMESLLAFVPDSVGVSCNFWLKYSMVRDGASLLTLLRHCRASVNTILAIETNEGFVFGSFTSHPWQLSSDCFYGSDESFLWRMRHSRHDGIRSTPELVSRENKIDVYPCTSKNDKIQFCRMEFLALGEGELEDMKVQGKNHFGNAIRLEKAMTHGSTSTSSTFGSPSLIHPDRRGEEFIVKNIEVWSLTPHSCTSAAIRAEMKSLFLEEGKKAKALNLLEILVG